MMFSTTIDLIKHFAGFRSHAYTDTSEYRVIGYGQSIINGRKVKMCQHIIKAQANAA